MNEHAIRGVVDATMGLAGQRILATAARALIAGIDDTGFLQRLQIGILPGETPWAQRVQEYGFTSAPFAGAEAAVVHVLGRRSHPLIIAVDDRRYRVKGLADGEVCIYTDLGQQVYLSRNGTVVKGGGLPITIQDTPSVTIQGDLLVTGKVVAGSGGADQVSLQTHSHGGVQAGGANTAAPNAGT